MGKHIPLPTDPAERKLELKRRARKRMDKHLIKRDRLSQMKQRRRADNLDLVSP